MAFTYNIEEDAFYQAGFKKGLEMGLGESLKIPIVIDLLKSGKLSSQEIADIARISVERVQEIAEKNNLF